MIRYHKIPGVMSLSTIASSFTVAIGFGYRPSDMFALWTMVMVIVGGYTLACLPALFYGIDGFTRPVTGTYLSREQWLIRVLTPPGMFVIAGCIALAVHHLKLPITEWWGLMFVPPVLPCIVWQVGRPQSYTTLHVFTVNKVNGWSDRGLSRIDKDAIEERVRQILQQCNNVIRIEVKRENYRDVHTFCGVVKVYMV